MGDSVVISKNITENQKIVLKTIDDNELLYFTIKEVNNLCNFSDEKIHESLENLAHKEMIFRIEKGKYCQRNFRNPYVIGTFMQKDGAIAYWSALNLHHLTEQIPNKVFVQSPFQKMDKSVFGLRYQFVKVKHEKICGLTTMGYGNESYRVTDVEKTLLDCFDLPQYSGGYEELIRAFYNANPRSTKLLQYGKQMGNLSVLKRIAFLSELFEMKGFKQFQNEVAKVLNEKYTLFDPMGKEDGEFISKWRIRLNIKKEAILQMISKQY